MRLLLLLLLLIACTYGNIFIDWHGRGTTVSIFPFSSFLLHPRSSKTPLPFLLSRLRAARKKKKKKKRGEKREKRKRTDTSVPFRVHHQALLLIVGKYSGAVTRGEFLEAGEPLCLARTRRVVTAGIISVSRDYRRMLG